MRPMSVVVPEIDQQHLLQVTPTDDQLPIQAPPPEAGEPALQDSVRPRSA